MNLRSYSSMQCISLPLFATTPCFVHGFVRRTAAASADATMACELKMHRLTEVSQTE
jgi:hypothetical protein